VKKNGISSKSSNNYSKGIKEKKIALMVNKLYFLFFLRNFWCFRCFGTAVQLWGGLQTAQLCGFVAASSWLGLLLLLGGGVGCLLCVV
jgi:hypothetical protein